MTEQTYSCNASEWHFARAYSFVAIPSDQQAKTNEGKGWFWLPLLLFIFCAIGSIIHMHWLWFAGIVVSFPLFIYKYQRSNSREYASLVKQYEFASPSNRPIPYISLNGKELICHFFRPDGSVSHQIKLQYIHGMAISTLRKNTRTLRLPAMINQRAREVNGEIVPEKYQDKQVYQLWIYTKTKVMHRSCITIPAGWFKDATFASFIDQLQQNSGTQLDLGASSSEVQVAHYLQKYSISTHEKRR